VEAALGLPLDRARTVVTHVRSVSPTKDMFCCAFPLPVVRGQARERAAGPDDEDNELLAQAPAKRRPKPVGDTPAPPTPT
jgi:hypothetical protein